MGYTERRPVPPLAPYVERLWDCATAPTPWRLERILPNAQAGLTINLRDDESRVYADAPGHALLRLPGASFAGPQARAFVIDTAEQVAVMGVQFRPGGMGPFLRERADRLADAHLPAADLFGPSLAALRERLLALPTAPARLDALEAWLLARLPRGGADRAIVHALARFDAQPQVARVGAMAADLGLSPRRFTARFIEQVGLSPKRYCRVRRLQALVQRAHGVRDADWAGLAADCGYADQAHLTREFRDFCGVTPAAWLRRGAVFATHVPVE